MSDRIKHSEVMPDGLYITFKDGREAIVADADIEDCAEHSHGFEKATDARKQSDADDLAENEATAVDEAKARDEAKSNVEAKANDESR